MIFLTSYFAYFRRQFGCHNTITRQYEAFSSHDNNTKFLYFLKKFGELNFPKKMNNKNQLI